MHRPPVVRFAVGRSRWYGRVLLLLWLLGVGVMLTFFSIQAVAIWQVWVWFTALMVGAGVALQGWRSAPTGILLWDGTAWHWSGFFGIAPCTLTLHLDLQTLLIVSVRQHGAPCGWLWLDNATHDREWVALRRAVVDSLRAPVVCRRADEAGADQEAV